VHALEKGTTMARDDFKMTEMHFEDEGGRRVVLHVDTAGEVTSAEMFRRGTRLDPKKLPKKLSVKLAGKAAPAAGAKARTVSTSLAVASCLCWKYDPVTGRWYSYYC
jgi:hypothetical protein